MNDVLYGRWDILEARMNDEEREFGKNQNEQLAIEIKKILANIVNNGILNSERPSSDSLLLLSKMCNESDQPFKLVSGCTNINESIKIVRHVGNKNDG